MLSLKHNKLYKFIERNWSFYRWNTFSKWGYPTPKRRANEPKRYGRALITPSNATRATALAGKALKKQGKKPLQYPFNPFSR